MGHLGRRQVHGAFGYGTSVFMSLIGPSPRDIQVSGFALANLLKKIKYIQANERSEVIHCSLVKLDRLSITVWHLMPGEQSADPAARLRRVRSGRALRSRSLTIFEAKQRRLLSWCTRDCGKFSALARCRRYRRNVH